MFYDRYVLFGGIETYLELLKNTLEEKGHEVFFIYLSEEKSINTKYFKTLPHKFKNKLQWFFSDNLIDASLYKKLRKHIVSINPDVIHIHGIEKATKTVLWAFRGYKKIMTVHNFNAICPKTILMNPADELCNGKQRLKCYHNKCMKLRSNIIDHILFDNTPLLKRSIKHMICPSQAGINILNNHDFTNTIHLPHSIKYQENISQLNSNNILFLGRISHEKGLTYLLDSFKLVLNKNQKIRLMIAGDGPDLKKIKDYALQLQIIDNIVFIRPIKQHERKKYYENSFAVIIPSIWIEMFGLVALEAMNYGKPIIASNIGGLKEIVKNDETGFLINRLDTHTMAEKIILLSENKELGKSMGNKGRELIKNHYSVESYIDTLLSLYKN